MDTITTLLPNHDNSNTEYTQMYILPSSGIGTHNTNVWGGVGNSWLSVACMASKEKNKCYPNVKRMQPKTCESARAVDVQRVMTSDPLHYYNLLKQMNMKNAQISERSSSCFRAWWWLLAMTRKTLQTLSGVSIDTFRYVSIAQSLIFCRKKRHKFKCKDAANGMRLHSESKSGNEIDSWSVCNVEHVSVMQDMFHRLICNWDIKTVRCSEKRTI
jgi:hypothetical protein